MARPSYNLVFSQLTVEMNDYDRILQADFLLIKILQIALGIYRTHFRLASSGVNSQGTDFSQCFRIFSIRVKILQALTL